VQCEAVRNPFYPPLGVMHIDPQRAPVHGPVIDAQPADYRPNPMVEIACRDHGRRFLDDNRGFRDPAHANHGGNSATRCWIFDADHDAVSRCIRARVCDAGEVKNRKHVLVVVHELAPLVIRRFDPDSVVCVRSRPSSSASTAVRAVVW
jgi:hypothetical protein